MAIEFKSSKIKHVSESKYTVDVAGELVKVDSTPELIKNLRGLDLAKTDDDLETYILKAAQKYVKMQKKGTQAKGWDDMI